MVGGRGGRGGTPLAKKTLSSIWRVPFKCGRPGKLHILSIVDNCISQWQCATSLSKSQSVISRTNRYSNFNYLKKKQITKSYLCLQLMWKKIELVIFPWIRAWNDNILMFIYWFWWKPWSNQMTSEFGYSAECIMEFQKSTALH